MNQNSMMAREKIPPGFWIGVLLILAILIIKNCQGGVVP